MARETSLKFISFQLKFIQTGKLMFVRKNRPLEQKLTKMRERMRYVTQHVRRERDVRET